MGDTNIQSIAKDIWGAMGVTMLVCNRETFSEVVRLKKMNISTSNRKKGIKNSKGVSTHS